MRDRESRLSSQFRPWVVLQATVAVLVMAACASVPSAFALPDGRGYELVSPPDTGAVTAMGGAMGNSDGIDCFETYLVTENGEKVTFNSDIGALEGMAANGVLNLYESQRTPSGWITESKSANGQQSTHPDGGLCLSEDHQYSTFLTGASPFDQGSLAVAGKQTSYIRYPDGSFVLPGTGTLGTDLRANVKWITSSGFHIILTATKRLEEEAPIGLGSAISYDSSPPVNAVYDRTALGLRVVSLLPSGKAPAPPAETTFYRGVSADGSSTVFEVTKTGTATLYEHRSTGATVSIVSGTHSGQYRFGGISSGGRRVVYLKEGVGALESDHGFIYVYDADAESSVPVADGTEAALVNVAESGQRVYFESKEAIAGAGQNPLGAGALPGKPNIYVWNAADETVHFVATVAAEDVEGTNSSHENLTEWLRAVAAPQQNQLLGRMNDPSRTTPDGSVFLFQARADVTGFSGAGHIEIYRYDEATDELSCVSCPNGGAPAASDAFLQQGSIGPTIGLNALARVINVTDDGQVVFFMTADALVPQDINETYDVYEWKDGLTSLISGGTGTLPNLLYGMSRDGRDVFFLTNDRLVPQDESSVLSIYDARIGGGFPSPSPRPSCEGELCQEAIGGPSAPASIATEASQEVERAKPKRGHKHRRHRRKHHHRRGGSHR